jgi:hypothetical protein
MKNTQVHESRRLVSITEETEHLMNPLAFYLTIAATVLRERWQHLRTAPERGSTAETVALIALLVVLAVGVVGVISAKVMGAANGISMP